MARLGLLMLAASAAPAATVTFTLSLDTAKDPGANYTNFHAAGVVRPLIVISFNVDVWHSMARHWNSAPVAAFCTELAEPIGARTLNTFHAAHLSIHVLPLDARQVGTQSAFIPIGGIGKLRAARVDIFSTRYYQSVHSLDGRYRPPCRRCTPSS